MSRRIKIGKTVVTREPDYDQVPVWCSVYGKECLHDGEECDEGCLREVLSAQDSDEATDRGDWQYHQGRR